MTTQEILTAIAVFECLCFLGAVFMSIELEAPLWKALILVNLLAIGTIGVIALFAFLTINWLKK